jgi:hypothetical protein
MPSMHAQQNRETGTQDLPTAAAAAGPKLPAIPNYSSLLLPTISSENRHNFSCRSGGHQLLLLGALAVPRDSWHACAALAVAQQTSC